VCPESGATWPYLPHPIANTPVGQSWWAMEATAGRSGASQIQNLRPVWPLGPPIETSAFGGAGGCLPISAAISWGLKTPTEDWRMGEKKGREEAPPWFMLFLFLFLFLLRDLETAGTLLLASCCCCLCLLASPLACC
jgi:hypothetical protein